MRRSLLLAAFAALLVVCSPARAQFCPGVSPWVFDDVAASDPFCGFVTWMAENGISLGCQIVDPNHRLYCPNDNVSRKQMAAFMNRLGNVRVEAVDTGPGLLGGPITSTGTISADVNYLQRRVSTPCAIGGAITAIGVDGSVTCGSLGTGTVTNVATGAGLTGGPITGSGTISADVNYLQRRVSTPCAIGAAITAIGADGSVTCGSLGTGTVTSVATGTGLTGGPITDAGTVSIATGGVGTNQLANSAVTLPKINASNGTGNKVLTTDGTNLAWERLPAVQSWILQTTDEIPSTGVFQFFGSTVQFGLPAPRRITATASAALGLLSGFSVAVRTTVCYQSIVGPGPILEFTQDQSLVVSILVGLVVSYSAEGSVVLPAGNYNVGFCVLNGTGFPINNNRGVRGWAMVTLD